MTNLELKSKTSLFALRRDGLAYANDVPVVSRMAEGMLLVKDFTGGMLASVGVILLVVNLFISGALLLRGPAYVVEFLAKYG